MTITYSDNTALTKEEIVARAVHHYGKMAQVSVMPDSCNAHDFIYYGLQQITTHRQLSLLYDKTSEYNKEISKLRDSVLEKVEEILDSVILDNESKVT